MATGNHQIKNKIQLPFDMVVDILSRLAVKSIKRFMGVAKSWGSLIQSPEFISAHCSFSSSNKVCPLVMYSKDGDMWRKWVALIPNERSQSQNLEVVPDFVVPSFAVSPNSCMEMVGCCNGIVCLRDWNSSAILLWNPATKEFRIVHFCPEADYKQYYYIRRNDVIGFGYDPNTKDFQLVRVERYWDEECAGIKRVTLYSLTTNSWTDFDTCDSGLNNNYSKVGRLICSNEICHFIVLVDKEATILSFDFGKRVFITTPFPIPDESNSQPTSYFSCMDGSLAIMYGTDVDVVFDDESGEDCSRWYHVWKLGEMGVKNSWIKLFTIGPISYVYRPIGSSNCTTTGDFFFTKDELEYSHENFVLRHQHPTSKQETITLHGHPSWLAKYAESLVSLI